MKRKFDVFEIDVLRHCIVDFCDPCSEVSLSRVFSHRVRFWRYTSQTWKPFHMTVDQRASYISFCRVLNDAWGCPQVQNLFPSHCWTCRGLYIHKTNHDVIFSPFLKHTPIPNPGWQSQGWNNDLVCLMFGTKITPLGDPNREFTIVQGKYDESLLRLLAIRSLGNTGIQYRLLVKELGYHSESVWNNTPKCWKLDRRVPDTMGLEEWLWLNREKSLLADFLSKQQSQEEILQSHRIPVPLNLQFGLPLERLPDPIQQAFDVHDSEWRERILDYCLASRPLELFDETIAWIVPNLKLVDLKELELFYQERSLRVPWSKVMMRTGARTWETLEFLAERGCDIEPLLSQITCLDDAHFFARAIPWMSEEHILKWLRVLLNQVSMCSIKTFMLDRSTLRLAAIFDLDLKENDATRRLTEDLIESTATKEALLLHAILKRDEIGCYAILGSVMKG
jgi:hypothetical protein